MTIIPTALLMTSLLFWSDRAHFDDPDNPSKKTEELITGGEKVVDFNEVKDGKVLLLVHGYNNSEEDAMKTYNNIFQYLADAEGTEEYTHVIGYLWPGCDSSIEYFEAKKNAVQLAPRMSAILDRLSTSCSSVDVLAHSMGNRLILEALKRHSEKDKKVIENYFSFAAAVDDDSIEKKHVYHTSTQKCRNMVVFHSNKDEVLKYIYLLAEEDEALGGEEAIDLAKLPTNIKLIDCTEFVDGHSGYFTRQAFPIYKFISYEKEGKIDDSKWISKKYKLVANGFAQPL